jgi:hypothetical protein
MNIYGHESIDPYGYPSSRGSDFVVPPHEERQASSNEGTFHALADSTKAPSTRSPGALNPKKHL